MPEGQDKEIQQYRDLVTVPEKFESGFGPKMLFAALFLGFIMVPGSIYLTLFMGASLGPAAQWVTLILFAEVTKRSLKGLRQQEIYLLFYMSGIAVSGQLHGGILSQLLWNQYLVQSPAAVGMGIADEIPRWVAPPAEVLAESPRTFFTQAWMFPIFFIVGLMVLQRVDQFGLGYALYRFTAHVEKLPFPMAPVNALGITALAESKESAQSWRWKFFSMGGVLGLAFGLVYMGLPAVTGALFNRPVTLFPIPWLDLTPHLSTETFLPAVPLNLVFDTTSIIIGMVLPFWAVIGGAIGLPAQWVMNPMLYRAGVLTSWKPGMKVVDTIYANHIDFYMSFGIGLMLAIFVASFLPILTSVIRAMVGRQEISAPSDSRGFGLFKRELLQRNRERGDISILISLLIYFCSSLAYIGICVWLMPGDPVTGKGRFPWLFFLLFAMVYRPIMGYANAKLEGMVGQHVSIPMVREASFILSGYQGAAIWFAPVPLTDDSASVRNFRVLELTGTKLMDVIKIELLAIPILVVSSLLFCELVWRLAPIPSETYPYTQEVWDLQARMFSLQVTATTEGSSEFLEAIKLPIIGAGFGAGLISFLTLSFLNLPTFLVFGAVRGLGAVTPGQILPELVGALIGRFYLEKKLGHQIYKRNVSVLLAGFMAGLGLVGMGSVAIAMIIKSTTTLGY